MPTTDQLRAKLIEKLQELFQLDQPELDFGFYRIMHAKAEQVQRFLENDLLAEVQQAFADGSAGKQAELKQAYEDALAQAKKFGAPDPEKVDMVMEAKGRYTAALDTTKAEAEVYDHLYRFFERYYEDGDFVSRRYLTRETAGKAAPYAVPYDGQEVMLHWANRDQYYIKTSEHFDHYTFDAREAARQLREEAKKNTDQAALGLEEDLLQGEPLRVHFRIVDAAEGEHNNVKESADKQRYFIVDGTAPIAFNERGELECRFTYRPDPEKTGQEGTWRQTRNKRNEAVLLESLNALAKTDPSPGSGQAQRAKVYLALLGTKAPTTKHAERSLLGKYIEKYSATNSRDYFIHKDLGGFLRRELDFYLKNEVMRLDDLENADAPRVEHYLAKLKVIRRIAHKLIDFLAQLENFQKRLWLKKKFVVETNYCITLDRVPTNLYPAIAANAAQKAEWEKLFAIEDLPGYEKNKPLTVDFLKANPYLVLDTAFLSETERAELLNALDDLDAQCNGLLVHSENLQALRMLEGRYREQVKCVYIDPPYNTGSDGFIYKDSLRHSSWATMIADRTGNGGRLMAPGALLFVSCDSNEHHRLRLILDAMIGAERFVESFAWIRAYNPSNLSSRTRQMSEHVLCYEYEGSTDPFKGELLDGQDSQPLYNADNAIGQLVFEAGQVSFGFDQAELQPGEYGKGPIVLVEPLTVKNGVNATRLVLTGPFRWRQETLVEELRSGTTIRIATVKSMQPRFRRQIDENYKKPDNILIDKKVGVLSNEEARDDITNLFGQELFSYPKPWSLVHYFARFRTESNDTILDYFAGSGTTGHAVVELNRQDNERQLGTGNRKWVLVEMGDYFDTVTKPRMLKVVYSRTWKDGVPVDRDGISHCFKYIRLESYEDTLNALELRTDEEAAGAKAMAASRKDLLANNKAFREDYTLRYMLDVETKESASLLNHTAFTDPRAYTLNVKKPGSEERTTKTVDLLETFNYLLGLRVQHIATPEVFTAAFERVQEQDVPKDQPQRLVVKGNLKPVKEPVTSSAVETWWFRKVQGWMPRDRHKPHGERDKVLIIWRTLTADREQDNAVLDTYFTKNRLEIRDKEYDVIYVNGSNNLPNLLQAGERWKVRLIEEDFHRLMWEGAE
jgi:adenine-specific DNA-methyltransferase